MTKQIKEYLQYIESFFESEHSPEEYLTERNKMIKRIEFYQHERLIHLLVTLAFAMFFLISLFMTILNVNIGIMVLSALFLVLLISYIKHYYFLENSVQRLYKYYYKIENL